MHCYKPNPSLTPSAPNAHMLYMQLLSSGMFEAVRLMHSMYPGRVPFAELHDHFKGKLPEKVSRTRRPAPIPPAD